jgi:hypothetical protein
MKMELKNAKTQEEAEKYSNESTTARTSKKTFEDRSDGGPVTRSKTQEIRKQDYRKILYSKAVKNSSQISHTQGVQKNAYTKFLQYGAQMVKQNNKKYMDPKIDQEKTDAKM